MKERLFVDMDGTLAVFKTVDTLETLYEQGYFMKLLPQMNVVEAVKLVMEHYKDEVEVFIMSAVLTDSEYALKEKNEWLDKYLPEINHDHRIFPPCGTDKKEYIPGGVKESDHLMDDYTHNLTLWQPPAKGIKLLNGINDTHGTWTGDKLDYRKNGAQLAKDIVSIIQHGVSIRDSIQKSEVKEEGLDYRKQVSLLQLAQPEHEQAFVRTDAIGEERKNSILSVNFDELKHFAEHNLNVLKSGNWSSFRGTEFADEFQIEADVTNAVLRYDTFLRGVEEQSKEFKDIFEFSQEFFKWMYEKEDSSSLYVNMELYRNDFYHEIVRTVGDMAKGNYSEIKMFINDNRYMDDWLDEEGTFREDIKEGLDRFEKWVNELEQNYSKKQCRLNPILR